MNLNKYFNDYIDNPDKTRCRICGKVMTARNPMYKYICNKCVADNEVEQYQNSKRVG